MTDSPTHMSGHRAAALLEDILRWKSQPWTPVEQVSAIRYDQDVVQGSDDRISLPFGLDSVIDSVDSDGAIGVCDSESVDKALRFWVPWFSDWVDQEAIDRPQPGAWMLQQLQENPVFTNVNGWHLDENGDLDEYGLKCQAAWDDYCEELKIIHRKIGRLTGNAPLNRGLCPRCKQGNMQQEPGPDGFEEVAICSNQKCKATIDYSREETSASIRAILRTAAADTWLTMAQVRTVWPRLDRRKLHVWIGRGKVAKKHGRYNLADINECMMPRRSKGATVVAEGV